MKNILNTAAIALTLSAGTFGSAGAQTNLVVQLPVSSAAIVAGAKVTVLADHSIVVNYMEKGITYKAFYSKDGAWSHTIASYEEPYLPTSVKRQVSSVWRGWTILHVDEIRTPGADPIYRIMLRLKDHLTIFRVSGDDMVIEDEYTLS